jgi:hypothetical protein
MNFITFFLTISPNTQRLYYTPALWTQHTVKGNDGKAITVSAVENGSQGKLPDGTPSAILPSADADRKNLPEKVSYDSSTGKVCDFVPKA